MGNPAQGDAHDKSDLPAFQCGICHQRYRRADHLARHTRIRKPSPDSTQIPCGYAVDSQHKPHKCHLCGKSFSRSDLLKRHIPSHTGPDGKLKGLTRNGSQPTSRVGVACRACASNHLRCSDTKPCKRCSDKGIDCVWDQALPEEQLQAPSTSDGDFMMQNRPELPPVPGRHNVTDAPHDDSTIAPLSPDSVPRTIDNASISEGLLSSSGSYLGRAQAQSGHGAGTEPGRNLSECKLTSSPDTVPAMPVHHSLGYPVAYPLPEDVTRLPDWNFLPGPWQLTEEVGPNMEPFFPVMDLDDGDMRFLDVYNQFIPFELRTEPQVNPTEASGDVSEEVSPRHLAASGPDAFRYHHWRFRPDASRDHAGAEEHNLSLPEVGNDDSSPESRLPPRTRITAAPLSVYTRDAIVALVVKHCRSENLSRIFTSFPSAELLDKLCQYYLTSPIARADTFIHVSSFDPKEKRPELLLAMVAAGAVLTADPTLTKFGYAMHEIIRPAVGEQWEGNNALTRNIELLQAFLIHLEIGLWSGHSRKIEITESFLQAPLTILRRAGKFKKNEYGSPPLQETNMEHANLQNAWKAWLQQESWKRLAYRALRHDTNSSTCLMVNPMVSYAEITLPLPCCVAVWTAANAESWLQARLKTESDSMGIFQPQSVMDFMDNPGLFSSHGSQSPRVDILLASHALLSCSWALAWECIQIRSFARTKPRRWSSLILSSRQDEIIKLLHNFRVSLEDQGTQFNDINLRLEHLLLHLHAPIDDIQIFAGMEGPEQAHAVHHVIKEWVDSEQARKALCHAGSIVRLMLKMPKGIIQGPLAFIMFHATIVLWAVSLVQSERVKDAHEPRSQAAATVWLDEEVETIALQRFVQLGTGKPYLRGVADPSASKPPVPISLDEPRRLLAALVNVFSVSYHGLPRPYLVEKMVSLLQALQASS
ncbi:hypothetical protein NLU13_9758 [Sarocladium strictum]|uniref:Uncharacterized protein n=1 Tax=Sarocladium strictum TaxID=5046 RepID=A0AA39GCZ7_SARSR|nr:hypothetical protein NLU13_9758 [Sarocladium strictum]